jgi:hypothetical protein
MPNNITQSEMVEITEGDTWEIVSQMTPDIKNLGKKHFAISLGNFLLFRYLARNSNTA